MTLYHVFGRGSALPMMPGQNTLTMMSTLLIGSPWVCSILQSLLTQVPANFCMYISSDVMQSMKGFS